MMRTTLSILLRNEAASVERLLQVTRYRGFQLAGLELTEPEDGRVLAVRMSVKSERPLSLLTAQLQKLYDVVQLEVHPDR